MSFSATDLVSDGLSFEHLVTSMSYNNVHRDTEPLKVPNFMPSDVLRSCYNFNNYIHDTILP